MPPQPGSFAELVRVPEANLVEIPDGLDVVKAALAEPIAVSYHAVTLGLRVMVRPASSIRAVVLGVAALSALPRRWCQCPVLEMSR